MVHTLTGAAIEVADDDDDNDVEDEDGADTAATATDALSAGPASTAGMGAEWKAAGRSRLCSSRIFASRT